MDKRCIVICDSGIGGLPLLKKLSTKLKSQDFVYYADYCNLPYGDKSCNQLKNIARDNCKRLTSFSPKLIVFACNTLSTNTIEQRHSFGVQTIGVLPKVKKEGKGLLLCTVATAKSNFVKGLKSQNKNLDVVEMNGLAEEVEELVFFGKEPNLQDRFKDIKRDYDFVSLGCTHYSFLLSRLKKIFPSSEFLSGEEDVFNKIVFSLTTFDTLDHHGEVVFVGSGAQRIKTLYNKGIL